MNHMIIIGDSRLNVSTVLHSTLPLHAHQSTSPGDFSLEAAQTQPDGYQQYYFTANTKYYTAEVTLHIITESQLVNYSLDPYSSSSQGLKAILGQANCAMVLFDTTHPGGFELIKKLYTNPIHQLLTQVDTHIFGGCATSTPRVKDNSRESTISNVTGKNWSRWQNHALDFNMQLIILDSLNYEPIDYHTSSSSDSALDLTDQSSQHQSIANHEDDPEDNDTDPYDLMELDTSEFGASALISAISCCSWPHMTHTTQAKLNSQHTVKSIGQHNTNNNPSKSAEGQADEDEQNASFLPATKSLFGVPLLPPDHIYRFDNDSMAEYHSLNDDFGLLGFDDLDELEFHGASKQLCALDILDILDGSGAPVGLTPLDISLPASDSGLPDHTSAKNDNNANCDNDRIFQPPKNNSNHYNGPNPSSLSPIPITNLPIKPSTKKAKSKFQNGSTKTQKKKFSDPFATLESLLCEASSIRTSCQSTRRNQATSIALRLAQSFADLGDASDHDLLHSIFNEDDLGLDSFGLMDLNSPDDSFPLSNRQLDQMLLNQVPVPDDILLSQSIDITGNDTTSGGENKKDAE